MTELTKAVKRAVVKDPHWKTTQGVDGWLASMLFSVTSQQEKSSSTFFSRSVPPGSCELSRKTSTSISRGSGPMNSGSAPSRTAAVGVVFHSARRLSTSWVGLKSNSNSSVIAPGVVL